MNGSSARDHLHLGSRAAGGRDEHLAASVGIAHFVGHMLAVKQDTMDGAPGWERRANVQVRGEPGCHDGRPNIAIVCGYDVDRARSDADVISRHSCLASGDGWKHLE
jgi:hypothetical protein